VTWFGLHDRLTKSNRKHVSRGLQPFSTYLPKKNHRDLGSPQAPLPNLEDNIVPAEVESAGNIKVLRISITVRGANCQCLMWNDRNFRCQRYRLTYFWYQPPSGGATCNTRLDSTVSLGCDALVIYSKSYSWNFCDIRPRGPHTLWSTFYQLVKPATALIRLDYGPSCV